MGHSLRNCFCSFSTNSVILVRIYGILHGTLLQWLSRTHDRSQLHKAYNIVYKLYTSSCIIIIDELVYTLSIVHLQLVY